MKHLSAANRWNADLIDQQYNAWLNAPDSLEPDWRAFFEGFTLAQSSPQTKRSSKATSTQEGTPFEAQYKILSAIAAYRLLGHRQAHINPLYDSKPIQTELTPESFGLTEADLQASYHTGDFQGGVSLTGKEIFSRLKAIYCGSVGAEIAHIQDSTKRTWWLERLETAAHAPKYTAAQKKQMLQKISNAEVFEQFLHTRFVGAKRFSIEGGEALMAAVDRLIEACPDNGVEQIVLGMAHRGRLTMLTNVLGKPLQKLFREFTEGYMPEELKGDGDVKYHMGFDNMHPTSTGKEVRLTLAANPSHLEFVDAVVEGCTRARQQMHGESGKHAVMPVLLHGDAAMIGQGIVAETLNIARLKGYGCGGTLHIVINNQIGFTTDPEDSRSTRYCTDIAKMAEAPIFHINGDDPLAVARITELSLEYRQAFGEDVVIDLVCYRKYGHNETDEPAFTQPTLYKKISEHTAVSKIFAEALIASGDIKADEYTQIRKSFEGLLEAELAAARSGSPKTPKKEASAGQPNFNFKPIKTAISIDTLKAIAKTLTQTPEGFKVNPKIERQLLAKAEAVQSGQNFDWALAETLAYGALVQEGIPVRISGQDCERGTFSHRHAVLYDAHTRARYASLEHIDPKQAQFSVYNSSLSECAILGFEYGYSLEIPRGLTIWEAQFGDFANGAQVIIDQFIVSGESKWQAISALTLLLPHGQEGQGPEHSSARLERFLESCAEDNIQVANVTTPAQIFHLLRRQVKRDFIKPLVIMSPKSLLRHKGCVSRIEDFTQGTFQEILDDTTAPTKPKRIILCSGKVYYDLDAYRQEHKISDVAILRIEQLYPLHTVRLSELIKQYKGFEKLVWCQEEPKNMGAWSFINPLIEELCGQKAHYAGRKAAASPAVGYAARHKIDQAALVAQAFSL